MAAEPRTSVLFEAPGRVAATLTDLAAVCGADRPVAVARELTKLHEEVWRGTLAGAAAWAGDGLRGEVVLVLAGAPEPEDVEVADVGARRRRGRRTRPPAPGPGGRSTRWPPATACPGGGSTSWPCGCARTATPGPGRRPTAGGCSGGPAWDPETGRVTPVRGPGPVRSGPPDAGRPGGVAPQDRAGTGHDERSPPEITTPPTAGGPPMFGRSTDLDTSQAPPVEPDDVPEGLDRAAFAAGCFWGVEEFFLAVPGVVDAVSGYEGGHVDHPTYEQVCSGAHRPRRGRPGHLRPDPGDLRAPARGVLAPPRPDHPEPPGSRPRDPVPLGRLRPQRGPGRGGTASLDAFQARFRRPIVTEVTPASTFWPAEAYHQRYTERTGRGGCHVANW